jgi:hypothetical protein
MAECKGSIEVALQECPGGQTLHSCLGEVTLHGRHGLQDLVWMLAVGDISTVLSATRGHLMCVAPQAMFAPPKGCSHPEVYPGP